MLRKVKQMLCYANRAVYIFNLLNIQKFCVLPTLHSCVLRGSQNKQRLFLYTTLTYRFLKPKQTVFTARYELGLKIRQIKFRT